MKTKELVRVLKTVDPESEVYFNINDGCCGDYLELEAYDFSAVDTFYVRIFFKSLPGYKSCIQAGGTKKADEKYWEKK